jgi:hypothetical protein
MEEIKQYRANLEIEKARINECIAALKTKLEQDFLIASQSPDTFPCVILLCDHQFDDTHPWERTAFKWNLFYGLIPIAFQPFKSLKVLNKLEEDKCCVEIDNELEIMVLKEPLNTLLERVYAMNMVSDTKPIIPNGCPFLRLTKIRYV